MAGKTYLYGDSTDSGLTINYIELLRDFLDFAAQLMLSEHRISSARKAVVDRKHNMEEEVSRLQSLGEEVLATLEKSKQPNSKSATEQCITSLGRATQETLRNAVNGLKQELLSAENELVTGRKRERAANARIIEHLLLNHELPDSTNDVDIAIAADGTNYFAEVKGRNQQGLHWRFIADIPADNNYAAVRKVAALAPEMIISLPEMSGFVRKSVKLKPYRVFPLYICGLEHKGRDILLKLRGTPHLDDESGLDVLWSSKTNGISIVRMQKGDTSPSYIVEGPDVQVLSTLVRTLSEESFPLVQTRTKLTEILFNNRPLAECEAPTDLIAGLIARIGPVIRSIVEHSLGDKELVLKQVLANDRRVEIFAAKTDLLEKLSVVPTEMRGIFAPLGIGDLTSGDELINVATEDVVDTVDANAAIQAADAIAAIEALDTSGERAQTNVRPETSSIEIEVMDIEEQVMEAADALPLTKSSDLPPMKPLVKRAPAKPAPLGIKIPGMPAKIHTVKGLQSIPRRDAPPTMPPRAIKDDSNTVITSAPLQSDKAAAVSKPNSRFPSVEDSVQILDDELPLTPLPRLKTNSMDNDDSIDIALAGLELE